MRGLTPMRRVLVLALPDLAVDLARRRRRRAERPAPGSAAPLDVGPPAAEGAPRRARRTPLRAAWAHPGSPLLLTETVGGRVLVAQRCPSAAGRGVRVGLSVDEARALLAPAQPWVEEHRPDRDGRALAALGQWLLRFSPTVALDLGAEVGAARGVALDLAGLQRLAGDEERVTRRILEALARLGFRARAAVADTLGSAWALAWYGQRSPLVVPSGSEDEALAPLPLEALRLPPATADGLRELSVERVGDLARLERARVAARFGGDVLLRLDQALGRAFEPLTPLRPEEPPELERVFDGPARQLEAVLSTIEALLHDLCATLGRAGLGVQELLLEVATSDRPPGVPPERLTVALGRSSANPRHLWTVVRPRAERIHLGYGVDRIRVVARRTARLPLVQTSAFDHDPFDAGHARRRAAHAGDSASDGYGDGGSVSAPLTDPALGELVDVLVSRFGGDAVRVQHAQESHVPERAYRARPLLHEDNPQIRLRRGAARATPAPRPSLLFAKPEPVQGAGTDLSAGSCVRWRSMLLELVDVLGPERISRPWWEARPGEDPEVTRDYYRVRTRCGRRLWLFVRNGAIHAHGEWA